MKLPLFLKNLRKTPARREFHALEKAADAHVADLQKFAELASGHDGKVMAAAQAFQAARTEENFERWMDAESRKSAAASIYSDIITFRTGERQAFLVRGGEEKILAACKEAEAELNARSAQIVADDERRSAELGVQVDSPAAMQEIARLRRALESARQWAKHDFNQSRAALTTVIGTGDE